MNDRLQKMNELGQAPWVDELSREDIQNGGLEQMIEEGIVGVTSNPAIFQKAIGDSDLYDDQLQELAGERWMTQRRFSGRSPKGTFRTLATSLCPSTRGPIEQGWLDLPRSPAGHRLRRRRDHRRGPAPARHGRPAQPLRQDTGDHTGPHRHRGDDFPRTLDQRNPGLLTGTLP